MAEEAKTMKFKHVAMVLTASLVAGCTLVEQKLLMHGLPKVQGGVLIMPFSVHNFGSECFDTLKCRVLYRNRYDTNKNYPSEVPTDAVRQRYSAGWMVLDHPSVVKVVWISRDGVSHDESIDLGEIFRSKLVRYGSELDVSDVNLAVSPATPDIILVVENRSIYVYMKAHIALLHPTDHGNKLTNFREDIVSVYEKKF